MMQDRNILLVGTTKVNTPSGKYRHSEYLFPMNNATTSNISSCESFYDKNFVQDDPRETDIFKINSTQLFFK